MSDKFYVALPFIYPVCPLSIDHARMFVLGDIVARYARSEGKDVFFPVASHYSGNTAQNISEVFAENSSLTDKQKTVRNIYKDMYETPQYIMEKFSDPLFILNYYSQAILWELRSLNVSCDYESYYDTKDSDFSDFVRGMFAAYREKGFIVTNKDGELALDYGCPEWKELAVNQLKETSFLQKFHKGNMLASFENIRPDWSFIRDSGYGVEYEGGIIDPMFDSELFTIFSLFNKYKEEFVGGDWNAQEFFDDLFHALSENDSDVNGLVKKIIEWLPCDIFICEEHLKNWVVKRAYAESALLNPKYNTQKYFVTGMGLLNDKRMSASRGNAILTKDLINLYGGTRARMIMLLTGGHPSKIYHYDNDLPRQADRLLKRMENYLSYLLVVLASETDLVKETPEKNSSILGLEKKLERFMKSGLYKDALLELGTVIPKKHKSVDIAEAKKLIEIYQEYLGYLLPSFQNSFGLNPNE